MYYAFLGTPYSFNWQDFSMQTALSSALGGFSSGIQAKINGKDFWTGRQNVIPSQALETPSGKIETAVTGMDRSKLTPNQLGKIGEEMAAAELRTRDRSYKRSFCLSCRGRGRVRIHRCGRQEG